MTRQSLLGILLIGIMLTSCGGQPAATEASPDLDLTVQAGAQTMVAAVFETQTAIAPPATNTAPPTVTPLPTITASTPLVLSTATTFATQAILVAASPTPTGTYYTATPLSSSLASGCLNLRLINSWTQPEGQLKPGQEFTQFWQVENNGSCDWLYVFQLVHVSGDKMKGAPARFSNRIPPGKWTTFSVDLDAPIDNGTYNATWRFSDGGGTMFGASLPVSITVKRNPDPTATPNAAQTAAVSIGQTAVAQTATAAYQNGINTAVAGTATKACEDAGGPPNPPCLP